ncbi:DDE-type integrase/transposase/recombinase [Rhodococcus opacus]|nr:DDE-type integrase/transposase/recombinase [Rhodococcus opacus]
MRTDLIAAELANAASTALIEPGRSFTPVVAAQYTSGAFRRLVAGLGIRSSMGRTGVCWDNSMAESFFAALKNECVYRTFYATKQRARQDIVRCIEGFTTRGAGILRSAAGTRTTSTAVASSRRSRPESIPLQCPKFSR